MRVLPGTRGRLKLASLIPPSDLLAKFAGLEAGLRRQRTLNRYGWIGGVFAAVSPMVEIARQIASAPGWAAGLAEVGPWWWALAALAFVLLETQSHIGPLTAVVRALVAERVPTGEFAAIYETFRGL